MSSQGDSVIQKALISGEINSTILIAFFWGMYTVVFIGTLYLYLTKKTSSSRLIIGAISVSYICYSAIAIFSWYFFQAAFVNSSELREGLVAIITDGPELSTFVNDIVTFIMAAVADGILIWRCFHVWNGSRRAILFPAVLLFGEIAVDLAILIFQCARHFEYSNSEIVIGDQLLGAQAFITFTTTLTAMTLISYRIYKLGVSAQNIPRRSEKLSKQILEILVQSSAAYCIAALFYAVFSVIPETLGNLAVVFTAQTYTGVIFVFASGFAPTVMVARIAFTSHKDSDTSTIDVNVSGLQFHVQSSHHGSALLSDNVRHGVCEERELPPTPESPYKGVDF